MVLLLLLWSSGCRWRGEGNLHVDESCSVRGLRGSVLGIPTPGLVMSLLHVPRLLCSLGLLLVVVAPRLRLLLLLHDVLWYHPSLLRRRRVGAGGGCWQSRRSFRGLLRRLLLSLALLLLLLLLFTSEQDGRHLFQRIVDGENARTCPSHRLLAAPAWVDGELGQVAITSPVNNSSCCCCCLPLDNVAVAGGGDRLCQALLHHLEVLEDTGQRVRTLLIPASRSDTMIHTEITCKIKSFSSCLVNMPSICE